MTDAENGRLRAIETKLHVLDVKVDNMTELLAKILVEAQIQTIQRERDSQIASLRAPGVDAAHRHIRAYNAQIAGIRQEAEDKIKRLKLTGHQ